MPTRFSGACVREKVTQVAMIAMNTIIHRRLLLRTFLLTVIAFCVCRANPKDFDIRNGWKKKRNLHFRPLSPHQEGRVAEAGRLPQGIQVQVLPCLPRIPSLLRPGEQVAARPHQGGHARGKPA